MNVFIIFWGEKKPQNICIIAKMITITDSDSYIVMQYIKKSSYGYP